MMAKIIIITGASGFIGRNLTARLAQQGNKIYTVVRPESARCVTLLPGIRVIELDMHQYDRLADAVNQPCDVLVSMAWNGLRGSDRDDPNIQKYSYENSMEAIRASLSLGCKTVILAGSQAEYGICQKPISEDTPCNPISQYGRYKLKLFYDAAELCSKHGVHLKEPRFFSVYGAGDDSGTLMMSLIKRMQYNRDCMLTQCTQLWDYLYIDDAVDAVMGLVEKTCDDGAYNVAYGESKPLKFYIEALHRLTGSQSRLLYGSIPYPDSGAVEIQACIDKIQREIGFSPQFDFHNGAARLIQDQKIKL